MTGFGQHLFSGNCHSTNPELTLCRDTLSLASLLNPLDSVQNSRPFPLVTPMETPESNPHQCSCILAQASFEGSDCFQLRISLPEVTGHSTTTSETKVDMSTVPKDYHDFTDIFSKSKLASSRPSTLRSQNYTGQRHFPTFGPIYSLSRRNCGSV